MLTAIQDRVVQGPVSNEAYGRHLIIDPTCDTNRPDTFPTQAVVVTIAARKIIDLSKAGDKIKGLVVAGERDPMGHVEFRAIAENLKELHKKWFPKSALVLVAHGAYLSDADLRHTLNLFDRPMVRFEYGTQKSFTALTGRKGPELKEIASNICKIELERWILNATFVRGKGSADNSTDSEIKGWLKYVEEFKPGTVRIGTIPKAAAGRDLKPVPKARMREIEALVTEKTGLPVEMAPGR